MYSIIYTANRLFKLYFADKSYTCDFAVSPRLPQFLQLPATIFRKSQPFLLGTAFGTVFPKGHLTKALKRNNLIKVRSHPRCAITSVSKNLC